jgi:hypothetical protein
MPPQLEEEEPMALWLTLTDAFGFLGFAGATIALASALVVVIAFILDFGDTVRIAIGIWPVGAVLALCNAVTGSWVLLTVALISLPVALALTAPRTALHSSSRRRTAAGNAQPRPRNQGD